jgi:hypothetical protein
MRFASLTASASVFLLGGCGFFTGTSPTSGAVVNGLTSPAGQLFCTLEKADGSVVVGLIDASAGSSAAAPVAVLATNAGAAMVQHECDLAAAAVGAKVGAPVPPPATPVTNVPIAVPAGAPTSAAPAAAAPAP